MYMLSFKYPLPLTTLNSIRLTVFNFWHIFVGGGGSEELDDKYGMLRKSQELYMNPIV